ncbi:hypothetical protein NL676_012207, partial [Syzygium grande]
GDGGRRRWCLGFQGVERRHLEDFFGIIVLLIGGHTLEVFTEHCTQSRTQREKTSAKTASLNAASDFQAISLSFDRFSGNSSHARSA